MPNKFWKKTDLCASLFCNCQDKINLNILKFSSLLTMTNWNKKLLLMTTWDTMNGSWHRCDTIPSLVLSMHPLVKIRMLISVLLKMRFSWIKEFLWRFWIVDLNLLNLGMLLIWKKLPLLNYQAKDNLIISVLLLKLNNQWPLSTLKSKKLAVKAKNQ